MTQQSEYLPKILRSLKESGLLLISDSRFPSVTNLVVGEPVRGSWWGHPRGREIYRALEALDSHPDILVVKFLSGKVTLIHRHLWQPFLTVASSREAWQMRRLPGTARRLLSLLDERGELLMLPEHLRGTRLRSPADAARMLESRLLVHSEDIHTPSGAHAKKLRSWKNWMRKKRLKALPPSAAKARRVLERKIAQLNQGFGSNARLPWLAVLFCIFLAFSVGNLTAADALRTERFRADADGSEFRLEIQAATAGTSWDQPGREAAVLRLLIDGRYDQHVFLAGGPQRNSFTSIVGPLSRGEHQLLIEWDKSWGSLTSAPSILSIALHPVDLNDPESEPVRRTPILHLRPNTVGRFSDLPILAYWEREDSGAATNKVTYTIIFTNEDGGTNTERLMARWGRTTDIEWCYSYELAVGSLTEEIQGPDHKTLPFRGDRVGLHPVIHVATDNNNFLDVIPNGSAVRVRPFPIFGDLKGRAREVVMDRNPWTYLLMAQEMLREKKVESPGDPDTARVSDLRNYAYVEACVEQSGTELYFEVQLRGKDRWYSSQHEDPKARIDRSGCVRSTVELPPGTKAADLTSLRIQCRLAQTPKNQSPPKSPASRIARIPSLFLLTEDYRPGDLLLNVKIEKALPPDGALVIPIPKP